MFPNSSSQLTKNATSIRKRKSGVAVAGVRHKLNCLSTQSTLHAHSSSCSVKRSKSLSLTMSKPIKSTSKKKQEKYVIQLGNQQLMQQFSKSGQSVVVKDGEDGTDLQDLTLKQKVKVFFILLMIPSAMFVFFGNNKFRDSGNSIDPNIQLSQFGGMAGFPEGFGRGFPGGGYDGNGRRHAFNGMRRHYNPEEMEEHLNRLDPRRRSRERNYRKRGEPKHENNDFKQRSDQKSDENVNSDTNWQNLNEANEEMIKNVMNSETNSDLKQNIEKQEKSEEIPKQSEQNDKIADENQIENNLTKLEMNGVLGNERTTELKLVAGDPGQREETIEPGYKIIVLWTPIAEFAIKGSQAFIDAKCVISKCVLTTNKSYSSQSDAIVFNARHVVTHELPNMRSSHQKWIFYSDSPQHTVAQDFDFLTNPFNWSWTYRSDSDIVLSYGNVEQMTDQNSQLLRDSDVFDIWRRKTKMVLWFANTCETNSKRETYVNQLKAYIDVDMYGNCSKDSNHFDIANETQLKTLLDNYMFVIVFEKNFCKDLVSKRLYQLLEHNIIPVVMGGADYSRIVPPNSVINANEFSSVRDLADYVLDIGSDFKKYKKYLDWKRNHRIGYERKDFCQLCYKLHEEVNSFKTYSNMQKWWLNGANCKHWDLSISPLNIMP